jgi:hypothetical protein
MNDLILIFKLYLHSIIYYIDQILKAILPQGIENVKDGVRKFSMKN